MSAAKFELTHKTLDAQYIERFFLGTTSKTTLESTINKSQDIDNAVSDYKNKLLNRSNYNESQRSSEHLIKSDQSPISKNAFIKSNNIETSQYDEKSVMSTPLSKEYYNMKEEIQQTPQSNNKNELLKSKMEKMRKAIDTYKEYKNEYSYSVHSQNSSRYIEECQPTPSKESFISSKVEFEYDNQPSANTQEHVSIINSSSLQDLSRNADTIKSPRTFTYDNKASKKNIFEYNKPSINDAPTKQVQYYEKTMEQCKQEYSDIARNLFESDFKHEEMTTDFQDQDCQKQSPQKKLMSAVAGAIYSLKSLQQDFYDTNSSSDTNDKSEAYNDIKQQTMYGTQSSQNSAFSLIHVVPTKSIQTSYKVPLASVQSTDRIYQKADNKSPYRMRNELNSSPSKDLEVTIQTLRKQLDEQNKIINEKNSEIQLIMFEKQQLEDAMVDMNGQIQMYIEREDIQNQLLRRKEEEIFSLSQDLKESQRARSDLQRQIENLRKELQDEIKNCQEEQCKTKEMEEVLNVCKDQINSFGQINLMSQCVIERLERQVSEYKFELEQAKDTIERQHDMYHQLVRTTKQEPIEEQRSNYPPPLSKQPSVQQIRTNKENNIEPQQAFRENKSVINEESQQNNQNSARKQKLVKLLASPLRNNPNRKVQQQRVQNQEDTWKIVATAQKPNDS